MTGTLEEIIIWAARHKDSTKLFDLTEHKETRGKKANRYFHRLVGLLAHGEQAKFYAKKNELIMQYGNHELVRNKDGKPEVEFLADNENYKADPVRHYIPTEYTDSFGKMRLRAFLKLRGTSTYTSGEMYRLIQCTRNECEGCGISREEYETFEEQAIFKELEKRASKDQENGNTGKGKAQSS